MADRLRKLQKQKISQKLFLQIIKLLILFLQLEGYLRKYLILIQ